MPFDAQISQIKPAQATLGHNKSKIMVNRSKVNGKTHRCRFITSLIIGSVYKKIIALI
jgi:hypothetical protein